MKKTNTTIYVNNEKQVVDIPEGFEGFFKNIRFDNSRQFHHARGIMNALILTFEDGILQRDTTKIDKSRKLKKDLEDYICSIDAETYYGYVDEYPVDADIEY